MDGLVGREIHVMTQRKYLTRTHAIIHSTIQTALGSRGEVLLCVAQIQGYAVSERNPREHVAVVAVVSGRRLLAGVADRSGRGAVELGFGYTA